MSDPTTAQSLLRGLRLLTAVAQAPEGLPLREAARRTGLKRPAAHKLLKTLAAAGFVLRESNPPLYRLGPAACDLARTQGEGDLLRRAEGALAALHARFPQTTLTLTRALGGDVVAVRRMSPERAGFLERPAGNPMSPYSSASTLLFQAFWPEELRAEYRRRHPFSEYGAHLWPSQAALDRFLVRARRAGCAEPELKGDSFLIAAPVLDAGGRPLAALGARMPATCGAAARRRLRAAVRAAARGLSAKADAPRGGRKAQ